MTIALMGLKVRSEVKVRVKVSVQNVVGGTSVSVKDSCLVWLW